MSQKHRGCILSDPSNQAVKFGEKWINLSAISRSQGIDLSFLSKILSGKRQASVATLLKIAAAVGMGLEEVLSAIEERRRASLEQEHREANLILDPYKKRIAAEDAFDKSQIRKGKAPIPRNPAFRLPKDRKSL